MNSKKAIICVLMTALAVFLAACGTDSGRDSSTLSTISTSSNTDASKTPAVSEETQISSQETEFEQESTYYHAEICGAVVTEQDGSPFFTYVKKCENCGKVQSGNSKANATGGVLHGSFPCSECKKYKNLRLRQQKIEMPYRLNAV